MSGTIYAIKKKQLPFAYKGCNSPRSRHRWNNVKAVREGPRIHQVRGRKARHAALSRLDKS